MTDRKFKVTIHEKGKERYIDIDKDHFVIGRGKDADLQLQSDLISREQVRVSFDGQRIWIEELGSSNGTWLDKKRIVSKKKIEYFSEQFLSLGSQEGPYLKIEYFADELEQISQDWHEEASVWDIPKAVGAPDYLPGPMKRPIVREKPSVVPKENLTVVTKDKGIEEQILQIKNEGEKKLFMHIKKLIGSEAEEIRSAVLDEANRVRKNAEEYSLKHYREAREKAERTIKEAESIAVRKMAELKSFESEHQKRLDTIRQSFLQHDKNVKELKEAEARINFQLSETEKHIKFEEDRIRGEILHLEEMKVEFEESKSALEARIEEHNLEERKAKAKMETELLEAKMRVTQLNSEVENLQSTKNTLIPEINNLKNDKNQTEAQLSELKLDYRKEGLALELLKSECSEKTNELEKMRSEYSETVARIEEEKQGLQRFRSELEMQKAEAEGLILSARSQADELLSDAQLKIVLLEDKRAGLSGEVEAEYQKLRREQENSISKLQEKKNDLLKEIEIIAVTAHEDYHKVVSKGNEEVAALRLEVEKQLEDLKDSVHKEIEYTRQEAMKEVTKLREEGTVILEEARIRANSLIENAQLDVLKERSKALHELDELENKKKSLQTAIDSAILEKEKIIDEGKARGLELVSEAEKTAGISRIQILESAEMEAKGIIARGEAAFKENKAKQQAILSELKHAEMLKIKEMRTKAEEEWADRRTERAKSVATNVFALIASEMYKARNKVMDETFIDTFSKELKELVVDTVLDRVGQDTDKLQQILKTSEDAKNKEKKFWKKLQVTAASTVAVLLIILIFPQVLLKPRDLIISAFSAKERNDSDAFLDKVKEARLKAVYNPATTVEFKDSYVDNVLFTTDYFKRQSAASFQDKWILELNDWFIKDLDVKDTTIIKFVSLETNLLKELEQLKQQIDSKKPDAGIQSMKDRELEFQKKLGDIFGDHNKVPRYYDYLHKFWNDFHHPRRPASSPVKSDEE